MLTFIFLGVLVSHFISKGLPSEGMLPFCTLRERQLEGCKMVIKLYIPEENVGFYCSIEIARVLSEMEKKSCIVCHVRFCVFF